MKTHFAKFETLWNGQPDGWGITACGLGGVKCSENIIEVDCKNCLRVIK